MFSRLDYSDEIVAKTLKNCLKHIIPDAIILLEKKNAKTYQTTLPRRRIWNREMMRLR